jgi:quinol monooxygenase YgiN
MSEQVSWIVDGKIRPGALDSLRTLIAEMVGNTQAKEPGTLIYEWYMDSEKEICHIVERYQDSAAAMAHLRTFDQKFAKRLGEVMEIRRVTLYGDASQELHDAHGGEGTVYLYPSGGFSR